MHFVHRRLLKLVLGIVSHPRWTLAIATVILAACIGSSLRWLTISTDENKLFSPNVPFFHDYLRFIDEFPENEAVYVVIKPVNSTGASPPLQRWTEIADRVTERLRAIPQYVLAAESRVPLDQLGGQAILFESPARLPAEFADAARMAPLAQMWGEKPGRLTSLLGSTPLERFLTGATARPDGETAGFVSVLAASWTSIAGNPTIPIEVGQGVPDLKRLGISDPSQLGYFYVPNQLDPARHHLLVRVFLKRNYFGSLTGVTETVNAIRDAATGAAADFPEFQTVITGRPALDADQMKTSDDDSHRAEVAALIAVFIGMMVMLRSVWLALAAEIALGTGIGWTFGWITVTVGRLNLLSLVFLIALIGIGMDYLVQILSRYRLEARRYHRPREIWVRVFTYVGPPINTACLGAAGAFLVSVFTSFRGAAELGIIAGGGLILCLAAGYTVLPALLTIWPIRARPLNASERYAVLPLTTPNIAAAQKPTDEYDSLLSAAVESPARKPTRTLAYAQVDRRGGLHRLALPAVLCAALLAGLPLIWRTHFDPGLIELQVPKLQSVEEIRTLQSWSEVELSRDVDQLRRVRERVSTLSAVASTDSILDAQDNLQWLRTHAVELPTVAWTRPQPISAEDLPRIATKARNLASVFTSAATRAGTILPDDSPGTKATPLLLQFAEFLENAAAVDADGMATRLSQWQVVFVQQLQELLAQFRPQDLDINSTPRELRDHLVSSDGTYALYIYPKKDLWNQANLAEFTLQVEQAVAQIPGAPTVTGIASNVYHTTESIHRSFFQATLYALLLIFLLVLLDFRRIIPTLAAISVLAVGLPMLLAIMGLAGENWNFANFFGLPILIGAGHEYGVFMVHRYLEAKKYPRRVWLRWDVSDQALLLCGFITSSSFGFFWIMAHHQGLRSLGWVMAVGTGCIYLATLLVLRPILRWRLDRQQRLNPVKSSLSRGVE